jgi:hypothetical protein
VLHPDDDAATHPAGPEPEWRESCYCNFFDTESRFCGAAWQGLRPHTHRAEAVFLLFDRERDVVSSIATDLDVPADAHFRSLGNQRFECIEPWSHWRAYYREGANWINLDWEQLSRMCDHDPIGGATVAGEGSGSSGKESNDERSFYRTAKHFEAAGRIEVDGEVDGERIAFTGFGQRDRAWGPRNYGLMRFMWWETVQFTDDEAAHVMLLRDAGAEMMLFGFLHRDGVTRPAAEFSSEVTYDADPGVPISARQRLVDDQGRELNIARMEIMRRLPLTILPGGKDLVPREIASEDESAYYWTWQRYTRDDGTVGHGMIDQAYWRGMQLTTFASTKAVGKLYDYGLERTSRAARGVV